MTGCDEEKIVASGPSHRSQCGELTDSHAITMQSSHAAMRVVGLTVGIIPQSYFAEHSGGDRWALRGSFLDRPRTTG
jgi:hypothetical protein